MGSIKENLMSDSIARQASAKLKCLDALTCIKAFTEACESYEKKRIDKDELVEKIDAVFTQCKYFGLVNIKKNE